MLPIMLLIIDVREEAGMEGWPWYVYVVYRAQSMDGFDKKWGECCAVANDMMRWFLFDRKAECDELRGQ